MQFPNAPLIIPNAPLIIAFLTGAAAARAHDPGHAYLPAPRPLCQGYLTVPPDALIAYHVPPNAFTPT